MKAPCELIVWDILPAIRAALAAEMVKGGASQLEVARHLKMAPSAVSQYLSKKRGYRIEFEDDIKELIHKLALDLHEGRVDDLAGRICTICMEMREEDEFCELHGDEA